MTAKTIRILIALAGSILSLAAILVSRPQDAPVSGVFLVSFGVILAALNIGPYLIYPFAAKTRVGSMIVGLLMLAWSIGGYWVIFASKEAQAGMGFVTLPFMNYAIVAVGSLADHLWSRRAEKNGSQRA